MRIRTKKRKKLLINNKKHIERKQNTFLQFRTLTHYKNGRIRSYYENYTFIKKKTNNLYIENHKLNRTKL